MNAKHSPLINKALDEILVGMVYQIMRYDPLTDILEEDREAVNKAKQQIIDLINREVVAELQHILAHGSGGGSWRLIIKERIRELNQRKAGSDE